MLCVTVLADNVKLAQQHAYDFARGAIACFRIGAPSGSSEAKALFPASSSKDTWRCMPLPALSAFPPVSRSLWARRK